MKRENTFSKFSSNSFCSINSAPSINGELARDNEMREKVRCLI